MRGSLLAFVLVLGGCACQPEDLRILGNDQDGGGEPRPARDERVNGYADGRFMYPPTDTGMCVGIHSDVPMPCGKVLLVCTPPLADGLRYAIQMPANYRCGPASPTEPEACAEQPEYAYFYNCEP